MAMKNIIAFIKWNFTGLAPWQYRFMAYMSWILGFSIFSNNPVIGVLGLGAMFADMIIGVMVDNYQRFKREQNQTQS